MSAEFVIRRLVTVLMIALCCAILWTPAPARAQATRVVSACSGVSLPRSVVTDIMSPVITGIAGPIEGRVNSLLSVVGAIPLIGALAPPLALNATSLLAGAAAGQNITLRVLDVNGQVVGPNGACETRADSFSLATPAGLSIGGNQITGLGATGQLATAGEVNSIAFGNLANTSAASIGAIALGRGAAVTGTSVGSIALGAGASATAGNSLALGAGSVAGRGALTGYTALGLTGAQTSAGEVSFGLAGSTRQLTNVAAGSVATDAVNLGQLQGVSTRLSALADTSVQYTDVISGRIVLAGTAPTISNLSAGTLSATSTEAVNGAQLFATNALIGGANTAITNLTNNITNGAVGPVRYSDVASPTLPNGGTATNSLTLVGAVAGPVGLHNLAAGALAATSTDAVNGAQVFDLASRLATGFGGTSAFDASANLFTVGLTYQGNSYTSVQAVLDALPAPGAGASPFLAVLSSGAAASATGLNSTAVGPAAVVSAAESVALGSGSTASRGALTGYAALGLTAPQTSFGEVSIGTAGTARQLTNVAAGSAATDAVNVSQLQGVDGRITALADTSVRYTDVVSGRVVMAGTAPTITNLSAGSSASGSTDAVNGGQIFDLASRLATGLGGTSAYSPTTNSFTVGLTFDGVSYASVQDVLNVLPTTAGGGAASPYLSVFSTGAAASATGLDSLAVGPGATATAANSASIGAGSTASRGAQTAYAALGLSAPQTSVGEVSFGSLGAERQLTNVAAGTALTDAVNLGQLQGVDGRITALADTSVQYTDVISGRVVLAGTAPTISNLSAGTLSATSTEAVNGAQLFATNALVGGANTAITNLTNNITNGAVGPVRYSDVATPTLPNGGTATNSLTLVGAVAGPIGLHNLAAGALAATSTDAVNGAQVFDLASRLATGFGGTSVFDAATNSFTVGLTYDGTSYASLQGLLDALPAPGGGGSPFLSVFSTGAAASATGLDSLAVGPGATATAANSASIGAGSTASRGAQTAYAALGLSAPQTSVGEVSFGSLGAERQLTNVAAGTALTDAVNLGQLQGVDGRITALADTSVRYADVATGRVVLAGTAPTITNLSAGAVTLTSTDAINGTQLFDTNTRLAANTLLLATHTTQITDLQTILTLLGNGGTGAANPFIQITATGGPASATADDTVAVGQDAVASAVNSVALGAGSVADRGAQSGYAALGLATPQTSAGEVSIGSFGAARQLTNVAAGSAATDAVNVSQLQGVADRVDTLSQTAVRYDDATASTLTLAGAGGTRVTNVAAGELSTTSSDAVTGAQLHTTNQTVAGHTTAIANLTTNITNGALGPVQYSNPDAPTVPNGGVRTDNLVLVGASGGPITLHNVAAGRIAAGSTDAVNGGQIHQLVMGAANAVTYDLDATGARTGSVTLAGPAPVALNNVAAGELSATSTQAVNGSQLFATNQVVASVGVTADAALAMGRNSVQYSDADRTQIRLGGPTGGPVRMSNLADGIAPSDAATMQQLNDGMRRAVSDAATYTDMRLAMVNLQMGRVRNELNAGTAGALAAAGLPQISEPGRGMMAVGFGGYEGQTAVAIGFSRSTPSGGAVLRAGATYDSAGRMGVNGGVGWRF